MKKLTFILMMTLCLIFTACNDNNKHNDDNTENVHNEIQYRSYRVDKVKVDNHDYIVARTVAGFGYGISIIHSESCECKKNK